MRLAVAAAVLAACWARPVAAQALVDRPGHASAPAEVDSLARVRVTQNFLEPRRLVGVLVAADTADLVVQRGHERLTVPFAYVERMEVSLARRTSGEGAWRGAKFGFLTGAGLSALVIAAARLAESGSSCADCDWSASDAALVFSLPLTGAATLTGAAVGASRPGDRWRPVNVPLTLRAGMR